MTPEQRERALAVRELSFGEMQRDCAAHAAIQAQDAGSLAALEVASHIIESASRVELNDLRKEREQPVAGGGGLVVLASRTLPLPPMAERRGPAEEHDPDEDDDG